MRILFNHDKNMNVVIPGHDWVEAVEVARRNHGNDRLYANEYIRSLGSALGGCAIMTESAQINPAKFAEAAEPPLNESETGDLLWGYNAVVTESQRGVVV